MTLMGFIKRFGPIALVLALLALFIATGLWRRLSLTELEAHHDALRAFVHLHPLFSMVFFVAAFVLVIVACTPGPGLMSVAAGYLFGVLIGGALNLVACVVGSILVFLACRTAFGDWAARRAGPAVQRVQASIASNAFSYILTLRLIPVVPFFAVNIGAGLAGAPLRALAAGTLVGSAPTSFILAGLGAGLGRAFASHAPLDGHLFARPAILLPLAALSVLSAAPIAWRLLRRGAAA